MEMAEQAANKPTPIYVSYLTFVNLLDWLRELGTLPSQFDRSFWGHKFSGSGGGQLMAGLRFLGLLEGDAPTDRLETLALASDAERKELLTQLLKDVYGAEFIASLPRTTPKLVNERLSTLGTTDATHAKARSFFVNASKAVGLSMPPQVAKQARNTPVVTRKSTTKAKGDTPPPAAGGDGDEAEDKTGKNVELRTGLHPLVDTLLKDLQRDGGTWTVRMRDRWRHMWDEALDYAYPATDEGVGGES
jgi:hypothetical protein